MDLLQIYSKQKLTENEEFIECLTHNSVVVQIPLFKIYRRNKLEKLLSIFEASTNHEVEIEELEDEDYQLVSRRLLKANANNEIRKLMDVEDEIISELTNKDRKIATLESRNEEANFNLKKLIEKLIQNGFSVEEIASDLNKSIDEINYILKL